jgi:hypothetical protein
MQNFSYPVYKNKWKEILEELNTSPPAPLHGVERGEAVQDFQTYKVSSPAQCEAKPYSV